MIIVKLMGGLGNQMFQYATARSLADIHKTELVLDASGYQSVPEGDTPREYELDCFPLRASLATPEQLSRIKTPDYRPAIHDRLGRYFNNNGQIFTFGEPGKQYYENFTKLRNNTYLVGWWQNEKYFINSRGKLLAEFTPQPELSAITQTYMNKIKSSSDTVSVHVRRGDYVTNQNASKHHGLAPIEYYNASLELLTTKLNNPTFYVFSDDITWCKDNLKASNITYIEGTTAGYEDLYLMSQCQHNIIANSSFSWWGAWLNANENKTVIAPKIWFQDEKANDEAEVVPSAWVRL